MNGPNRGARRAVRPALIVLLIVVLVGASLVSFRLLGRGTQTAGQFNGQRALGDLNYQVSLGPRIPGTDGHRRAIEWIVSELTAAGWETGIQTDTILGQSVKNIVAQRAGPERPWILLGAHYDTRMISDKDPNPNLRDQPVPGANDGGSGVAVLLELARVLPDDVDKKVWLVFFDAEDNGDIPGWDWILGSRAFVAQLGQAPDAVVILDMVGDSELELYLERNSDPVLSVSIWSRAAGLGYSDTFIPTPKYAILDDHIPFLQAGIPAVNIIDFDYPYHHTTADTVDKVSAQSLQIVGDVVLSWLMEASLADSSQ